MSITSRQFAILGMLGGWTLEISVNGVISTIVYHFANPNTKRGAINWTAILMTNFNFACIVYMLNFFIDWFLGESNCVIGNLFGNSASHYFYLSFDLFVLFKTCVISGFHKGVVGMAGIIFVNRLCWTALDISRSGGYWDPVGEQCNYYQFPMSGIAYNASDMICDMFCTLVSVFGTSKISKSRIAEVILQENFLRSLLMFCVNSYAMYAALNFTDPFLTLASFMIQNYTYARLLNLEHFWIGVRKRTLSGPAKLDKQMTDSDVERGSFINTIVSSVRKSRIGAGRESETSQSKSFR